MQLSFEVMIVEEDRFFSGGLAKQLEPLGFRPSRHRTLEEAIALLEGGARPTVLLINRMIPDILATEACVALKGSPELAGIPIVLYGDGDRAEIAAEARQAQADGYLVRPFKGEDVVNWIRRTLFGEQPDAFDSPHTLPPSPPTFPPTDPAARPSHDTPVRILLCDDDPLVMAVLGDTLEEAGYELDKVNHWEAFREAVMETAYSVIFQDIDMPGLTGDKLALFVKTALDPPRPRVILFSGRPAAELAELATKVGAYGYLCKGSHDHDILRMVRGAVQEFQRHQQVATF